MIAIRTSASDTIGIGHLVRSSRLAHVLRAMGFDVRFFVDYSSRKIQEFVSPCGITALYETNESFIDQRQDANRFRRASADFQVQAVIVDDYRLGHVWEAGIQRHASRTIVFDDRDLGRHHCDMIIDAKWTGDTTYARYSDKVPEHCQRLLGPDYLLLPEKTNAPASTLDSGLAAKTCILFSLGGGGDMELMARLLEGVLSETCFDGGFHLLPIIGPFAFNRESVLRAARRNPSHVTPLMGIRDLGPYFEQVNLFVGAAGGTLYEALCDHVPCITFSLNSNQANEVSHLEDMGHYFHLGYLEETSIPKVARLVKCALNNLQRFNQLYRFPAKLNLDRKGAYRIANAIVQLIESEGLSPANKTHVPSRPEVTTSDYHFELVDDRHINRYLAARNRESNLRNMTQTRPVSQLDHYLWWFQSRRESYLLSRENCPLLYIWHQTESIENTNVLYGGWFTCTDQCNAIDVMYALKRQLGLTDQKYPDFPWIAVIKRHNRFVLRMNQKFGFEVIDHEHQLLPAIKQIFSKASYDKFHYLVRQPRNTISAA